MSFVKVCGMTREADVELALDAGVTHLGLIFAPRSPRAVDAARGAALARQIGERATPVGVFRAQPLDEVRSIAEAVGLRWVQLHGGYEPSDASALRADGYHVIWATPVTIDGVWDASANDVDADLLLLDTKTKSFGGTGESFAWSTTRRPTVPFVLAGGLGNTNALDAQRGMNPVGLDLNSVLEDAPGEKNHEELRELKTTIVELQKLQETLKKGPCDMNAPDGQDGRWGRYGGAYIPETLFDALSQVERAWDEAREDASFWEEFHFVMKHYVGRPSPITRAPRLEAAWGAKGPIYFKREDLNHTGAHKINNSMGQLLLAKRMGRTRIVAETGAGQHGVATATACAKLGLDCVVYMGEVDMARQALNVFRMRMLGAEVRGVDSGSRTLKDAINEAMRDWVGDPENTFYCLGSALGPHPYPQIVRAFQSIIGTEARVQWLEQNESLPDAIIACVGGGSNSIGIFSGFMDDEAVALYGGEAGGDGVDTGRHAARFAGGEPGVLHGCRTYLLQDEGGQIIETHSISAGLDYPAIGPEHAWLHDTGRATYLPVNDDAALSAFHECCRLEGIFPALESAHAVALAKRLIVEDGIEHANGVLVNMSGRGDKDVHTVAAIEGVEL